ncbi:MAG: chromate transporter [Exilispira sp.]
MIRLFIAFSLIGLFAFGGGYSALSIMEDLIVQKFNFISKSEFWAIVGVAQITPGPIALNIATFVGAQKAKVIGAITATTGVIFFPSILSFILILIYKKSKDNRIISAIFDSLLKMIPALILLSILSLFIDIFSELKYFIIILIGFLVVFLFPKISIILKILFCGFVSVLIYIFILS